MNYRRSKAGVETPLDRHLRSMLLDSTPYQYEYVFVANCDNRKSVVLQPLVYPLHNPGPSGRIRRKTFGSSDRDELYVIHNAYITTLIFGKPEGDLDGDSNMR
jgi:hypothetical protein